MKKKGFTLVELLAVIAILAVLVIIALPNVLRMFRNAKQNTFTNEVQNLVRSAEDKFVTSSILSGKNTCFDSSSNPLDMSGRDNLIYKIKLTNKGKVIEVYERDNDYELIANRKAGINRADIGSKYKVESAKTGITDCNGNELISGESVKKYAESTLNGADPVLGNGMVPITLSNDGVATYADEYDKWYSYKDKQWANSVILVNNPSKKYEVGDKIEEKDIRAYFVWIPKYSYRIFNMGNYDKLESTQPPNQVKEIEIVFGTSTTGEEDGECKTPMESGLSKAVDATKDCKVGDLMTHPAFLSIPSNGFWVGKFETGYNQNVNTNAPITNTTTWTATDAVVNEEKPNNIIVKPNVYSWRGSTVYNYFMSEYSFNRNLDSHMIKNTEWGAVAYLSHSKYGLKNEVRINNNSNYLTGSAAKEKDAVSSATENTKWNTTNGYTASTTGNITGVYDMSGGAWEYVSIYVQGQEELVNLTEIVNNPLYTKYLDKYSSSSNDTSYKYRILGDATGEMGPFYNSRSSWYNDFAVFTRITSPVFIRGGYINDKASTGQFSFHIVTLYDQNNHRNIDGTRLTLTPTN